MQSRVKKVIDNADIVLEVVDARNIPGTRNTEIEQVVRRADKKLIVVANKSDLFKPKHLPLGAILFSSRERKGTSKLRERINRLGNDLGLDKIRVGVVGYANTGKSSVINALGGHTRTSSTAGFTKGEQWVKITNRIMLFDSPGEIPIREEGELALVLKGVFDVTKVKDAIGAAMELISRVGPDALVDAYNVRVLDDSEEQLLELANIWMMVKKGGKPDLDRASRKLLKDWQKGVLK
jgi:ribosome biogenesis GTPase A